MIEAWHGRDVLTALFCSLAKRSQAHDSQQLMQPDASTVSDCGQSAIRDAHQAPVVSVAARCIDKSRKAAALATSSTACTAMGGWLAASAQAGDRVNPLPSSQRIYSVLQPAIAEAAIRRSACPPACATALRAAPSERTAQDTSAPCSARAGGLAGCHRAARSHAHTIPQSGSSRRSA